MSIVPPTLLEYAARGPSWATWIDALPALARELLGEWELRQDGPSLHGHASLVLPVRTRDGSAAALKIGWPHWEAEHEALALQRWHGGAAVRLLRADPHRWALLLERAGPEDLTQVWDVQACGIVGGLYERLHVPAPPQLRTLSDQAARWAAELDALPGDAPVPRRMVEHARSLAVDLARDPATDGRIVHTDLHYENVLAGARVDEAAVPWLVIDPKPLSGDPHYEVAPMLWNRFEECSGRVREAVRDRFFAVVDAAGLDEDRARDWVIVRMLVNIKEEVSSPGRPDRDRITTMLSIAKAVQG